MKGHQVIRKAGWDCHGLPVEIAVEKELGFSGKGDIEKYGIAEFNAKCRISVQEHVDEFIAISNFVKARIKKAIIRFEDVLFKIP